MTSVSIESNVKSIGNYAFYGCNQLANVSLAENTNLTEIGAYAFGKCSYLSSIKIPDQVLKVGDHCFDNCTNLSAANLYGVNSDGNTSLQQIGDGLFYNCTALKQISLPDNLTSMNTMKDVFNNCSSLDYICLSKNAATGDTINHTNFTGCSSLVTVKVPSKNLKFECSHAGGSVDALAPANLGAYTAFPTSFTLPDEFVIMGYNASEAHTYALHENHQLSFCYLDAG